MCRIDHLTTTAALFLSLVPSWPPHEPDPAAGRAAALGAGAARRGPPPPGTSRGAGDEPGRGRRTARAAMVRGEARAAMAARRAARHKKVAMI